MEYEPCPPHLDDDGRALWEYCAQIVEGGLVSADAHLQLQALFVRRQLRQESEIAALEAEVARLKADLQRLISTCAHVRMGITVDEICDRVIRANDEIIGQYDEVTRLKAEIQRLEKENSDWMNDACDNDDAVRMLAEKLLTSDQVSGNGYNPGIGGWCEMMAKAIDELQAEIKQLRGAMAADDGRLRDASNRIGIITGCDTPGEMADEIERLRKMLRVKLRITTQDHPSSPADRTGLG